MDRRSFLTSVSAAALTARPGRAANGEPRNILMMFSDDHAWQAVSAYGGNLMKTRALQGGYLMRRKLRHASQA